jgi:pimeloyl-ACP methyl ester carboxylesterase
MDQFGYLDRDTPTVYHGFAIGRIIANAGHNLPQEEPEVFVQAILDVLSAG